MDVTAFGSSRISSVKRTRRMRAEEAQAIVGRTSRPSPRQPGSRELTATRRGSARPGR